MMAITLHCNDDFKSLKQVEKLNVVKIFLKLFLVMLGLLSVDSLSYMHIIASEKKSLHPQ